MKKILILAAVMTMLFAATFALNAYATDTAEFSCGTATAKPGEQVTVSVSIDSNPGFFTAIVRLSYDTTVLTLDSVTNSMSGDFTLTKGSNYLFESRSGEDVTATGELLSLTFTVSENAAEGSYPITMLVWDVWNNEPEELDCTVTQGAITVPPSVPETPASVGETIIGYSLTLQSGGNGDIGINLSFKMNEALRYDTGAYLSVTKGGNTEKVYVSEFIFDAHEKTMYTTYVCAKNMSDDITVTVYNGEGECGANYTYSVKRYAEYILENSAMQPTSLVNLVKALLNYGAAAQEYFDYTTLPLANESMSSADKGLVNACTQVGTAADRDVTFVGNTADAGVASHTATLLLGSKTTIRHYVTLADGTDVASLTFSVGGKALTATAEGSRYYVDITDIPAAMLNDGYTLTVTGSQGSYSVTYSALNYLSRMYDRNSGNAEMAEYVNLLKAMYLYNQAAELYFN